MTKRLKISDVELAITEMLLENTGSHMLDSGGAYGRHHEQNNAEVKGLRTMRQKAHYFRARPSTIADVDPKFGIDITSDLWHFLVNRLDVDNTTKRIQRIFDWWYDKEDEAYCDSFGEWLKKRGLGDEGYYGAGSSYSLESTLNQGIQWDSIKLNNEDEEFIILQVHGGCDQRGGYTHPRIFRAEIDSIICGLANTVAHSTGNGFSICWQSDCGGYEWYSDYGQFDFKEWLKEKESSGQPFLPIIKSKQVRKSLESNAEKLLSNLDDTDDIWNIVKDWKDNGPTAICTLTNAPVTFSSSADSY